MFPGDTLNDGTKLGVTNAQCSAGEFKDTVIYVSPSIKYASQDLYAQPYNFQGKKVKVVFQCRVKPGSFKKFQETLDKTRRGIEVDEEFPNDKLEWATDDRTAVVPYGLLIAFFD